MMHPLSTLLVETFRAGGKVLICGNGGFAAMSSHFAGELMGRYKRDRPPLPAISLCADTSVLTAIANDYGYESTFDRQIQALAKEVDCVVFLSTSGVSPNILRAELTANSRALRVGVITGPCVSHDWWFTANTWDRLDGTTAEIQEAALSLIHRVCGEVEDAMFPGARRAS